MAAGIEALLAWTKDGVTKLDIPHLSTLCAEVEGHELLGENICVIRGKFRGGKSSATKTRIEPVAHVTIPGALENTTQQHSFVEYVESFAGVTETEPSVGATETVPSAASPILLFNTTNVDPRHPYLRFVHNVFEQFPQRYSVAEALKNKSQLQVSPTQEKEVFASLEALHEASEMGISSTQLYLPKDPQGIVSLILQEHGSQVDKKLKDNGICVQSEIFRLLHLLRTHGCGHILYEGIEHGSASDVFVLQRQLADFPVRGSVEKIFSAEGQELLCANPDKLYELLRFFNTKQRGEAMYFIFSEQFPFMDGAEDPLTIQEPEAHMAASQYYSALRKKMYELMQQYAAGTLSNTKELQFVLKCWLSLHLKKAQRHAARDQYTISLSSSMLNEHVPHIVFGAAHLYTFLQKYADLHTGVLVTVPSSHNRTHPITEFMYSADERDTFYTHALHVFNEIRGADGAF